MERVVCLIDGFNLYHGIDKTGRDHLKWCDYKMLAGKFLREGQVLSDVFYFTGIARFLPEHAQRHERFIAALGSVGVKTVLGRFKRISRKCGACHKRYTSHEEKETDVNLAVYLTHLAHSNAFDTAIVISADSDFSHAIRFVREAFPTKIIGVVFPVSQRKSNVLASVASFTRYMDEKDLRDSLFPARVIARDGSVIFRPSRYDPPEM